MQDTEWQYRDGAAVEGTPSWEAVVDGVALRVRRAVSPFGYRYWWTATIGTETHSSLWKAGPALRTYARLDRAQRRAETFAKERLWERHS